MKKAYFVRLGEFGRDSYHFRLRPMKSEVVEPVMVESFKFHTIAVNANIGETACSGVSWDPGGNAAKHIIFFRFQIVTWPPNISPPAHLSYLPPPILYERNRFGIRDW
ncbi:hypothetical protein QCA50_008006 [Cerrena zonata]|uniref:Uncharacterized protein n=1 Tax=Cerrena zonata TaxID=2478898 RepID=A0AAW0G5A6_9APHY